MVPQGHTPRLLWCAQEGVGKREDIPWFIKVYQTEDFASRVAGNTDTLCPRKCLYVDINTVDIFLPRPHPMKTFHNYFLLV